MDMKGTKKKGFEILSGVASNVMKTSEAAKKSIQIISGAASNVMGVAGKSVASVLQSDSTDICITKHEKNGAMRIDHDNLRKVLLRPEIGDLPVAIISIAGSSRTGKSYLMNFIARFLKNTSNRNWMDNEGTKFFQWRGGTKRTTTGIRFSNEVFKIHKDGREVAVLLMDTQGLFDSKTPEDVNTTLLTLSTLMSSVQIFNTKTAVNTQDLKYLKTCVDFAMATAQSKGPYFKLQRLVFLVRDTVEEDDDPVAGDVAENGESRKPVQTTEAESIPDFGFERGEKYMTEFLDSDDGGPGQKAIRQRIKQSFNKVKCFMMPFPGPAVMTKKFTGNNHELSDEFKENVKQFVEDIANPDNLPIKTSWDQTDGGQPARKILNMIAACDSLFAMKLYNSNDLMEANVKAYYASEYQDAIAQYDKMMQDVERKYDSIDKLQGQHKTFKKQAKLRYKIARELGDGEARDFYAKHLEDKCEEHFKTTIERWEAKQSEEKAKRTLKTAAAFVEYESLMQKNLSKGSATDEKLENYHNENLQCILQKYKGKIDADVLRSRTEHYFREVKRVNDERRESEEKLEKEQRERRLFGLSVTLQDKASKMWSEKLKSWIPEEKLTSFGEEVRKEVSEDYFQEALRPIEKEYRQRLNALMDEEYEKVTNMTQEQRKLVPESDGKGMEKLKERVLSELKKRGGEEERKYQVIVADVFVGYVSDLQHDLTVRLSMDELKNEKLSKMKKHRLIYYANCCLSLKTYYTDVLRMLEKKVVEAKNRNEQNWSEEKTERMLKTAAAFAEYESLMQKSKGSVPDEKLENHHNENQQYIRQKYEGKIDTDVLRSRTEHYFSEVKRVNDERRESEEKLREEQRERRLLGLTVTLQDKASKMWSEKLKSWIPEEKLTSFGEEVMKEVSKCYFHEAVLPMEEEYRLRLNIFMKTEYEKFKDMSREQMKLVLGSDGKGMQQLKGRVLSELKKRGGEEERKYQVIVADVLVGYVNDLQHDLTVRLSMDELKKEKQKKHRLIYYAKCCVSLETYYNYVLRMLEKKVVEAKNRNNENWENITDRLKTIVHSSVLEVEKNLKEKMRDQYLDKKALREHYDDMITQLAENAAFKLSSFVGLTDPKISNEFKRIWIEKLEESHGKMEKVNEENKLINPVTTEILPDSSSWWKKLWKAIKEVFTRK